MGFNWKDLIDDIPDRGIRPGGGGGGMFHSVPTILQADIGTIEHAYHAVAERRVRLVVQIFGRPTSPAMKTILADQAYFHLRSAELVNFYFVGYAGGQPPSEQSFEPESFIRAIADLEERTTWQYGEETDLFVLNSIRDPATGASRLDYSAVVAIRLERALADKAIPSVPVLLGELIRATRERAHLDDPTWGFSEGKGKKAVADGLKKMIFSFGPKWLEGSFDKAKHFVVTDVSRDE